MTTAVYGKQGASKKKRDKFDHYKTPDWAVKACVCHIPPGLKAVDAGCSDGVWGKYYRASEMVGVDLQTVPTQLEGYTHVYSNTDYLTWEPPFTPDIVIGNPPYHLFWKFFWKSWRMLPHDTGLIAWVLPVVYLQGEDRYQGIFKSGKLAKMLAFAKRLDFTGGGSPHDQSGLYIFDKTWRQPHYIGGWLHPVKDGLGIEQMELTL